MKDVIGVRFRTNGKIYFFDPLDFQVEVGQFVIVETARAVEYGKVVLGRRQIDEGKMSSQLKPIIRLANEKDAKQYEENKEKSKKAYDICIEKIKKHGLVMKLIDAEYTFDNNKVLFYFTAEGRVDFRELVKDLAAVFKTRIELRQIGVRDETKIVGGIGICGRELCCHSHLSEFAPVSIKMAKEQNLSLNPTKISGVCGRLMCCLNHEQDTYVYLNERMPNVGDIVKTKDGKKGEVHSVNVLRQKVKLIVTLDDDTKEIEEYSVDDLRFKPRKRKNDNQVNDAELKALEALESKDVGSKLND
ncbi:MAG: stage 0 sporulation family protein [Lachnospiraceae bacterium]|nr:stage 0 sporulation family protein [Lachnospiraceae bacterium]